MVCFVLWAICLYKILVPLSECFLEFEANYHHNFVNFYENLAGVLGRFFLFLFIVFLILLNFLFVFAKPFKIQHQLTSIHQSKSSQNHLQLSLAYQEDQKLLFTIMAKLNHNHPKLKFRLLIKEAENQPRQLYFIQLISHHRHK